jgi:hypothetical protein
MPNVRLQVDKYSAHLRPVTYVGVYHDSIKFETEWTESEASTFKFGPRRRRMPMTGSDSYGTAQVLYLLSSLPQGMLHFYAFTPVFTFELAV